MRVLNRRIYCASSHGHKELVVYRYPTRLRWRSPTLTNKCLSTGDGEGQEAYEGQGMPKGGVPYTKPEDTLYHVKKLRDLYFKAQPDYNARFTVPIIWDTKTETIVNNESSEVIRFLNTAFDDLIDEKYKGVTYYPEKLRKEIDELNDWYVVLYDVCCVELIMCVPVSGCTPLSTTVSEAGDDL